MHRQVLAIFAELDTIFATLTAASLRVRSGVVDGDFSAMAVVALGLDDEREQTIASMSFERSDGQGSLAMTIW